MIYIMGKSSSGKSTIVNKLVQDYDFKQLVTCTTRPKRDGEEDGVDYHFLTDEKFLKMKEKGFFAEDREYETVHGTWRYGSLIKDIENADDKTIAILTPEGIRNVMPKLSEKPLIIYIYSNIKTIEKRLIARGDDPDEAHRRIRFDNLDFTTATELADKILYNNEEDDLDDICRRINIYVRDIYE